MPRERVADVASALLRLGPVADLAIEEAPVEDIVRELFTASANAAGEVRRAE